MQSASHTNVQNNVGAEFTHKIALQRKFTCWKEGGDHISTFPTPPHPTTQKTLSYHNALKHKIQTPLSHHFFLAKYLNSRDQKGSSQHRTSFWALELGRGLEGGGVLNEDKIQNNGRESSKFSFKQDKNKMTQVEKQDVMSNFCQFTNSL